MDSYKLSLFLTLWVIAFLLTRLGLSKMFKSAGVNPVFAWIPIFNWWYWIKMVGRPAWYMIGMLIPGLNILFSFNIKLDILRSFGKFKFGQQFMGIVLTFIYFPILFFDKKLTFMGPGGQKEWREKNVPKHNGSREWADAILFAAYVAGGMRGLYFDLYQIPTPSMESNLKVGDYLVVSRAKIGMRIPMTPISIPVWSPKEIMGLKAYSELLELPYMRLPGWYTIKNNDVIVFNWPADDGFPTDKKDNFVKRCVGIPGNTVQVKNGQVFINGKPLPIVGKQQKRYLLLMKEPITQEFMLENDLGDYDIPRTSVTFPILSMSQGSGNKLIPYYIYTYPSNVKSIKENPLVSNIFEDILDENRGYSLFPDTLSTQFLKHHWDINNYGPVYLPKRGETIKLTSQNWDVLKAAINTYEHADIREKDGKFYDASGTNISEYTFKMGYYWMMGDNRYNSSDSRVWGYVPEDHIIGKPLFTFLSLKKVIGIMDEGQEVQINGKTIYVEGLPAKDPHSGAPIYDTKGIRWNKIFRSID